MYKFIFWHMSAFIRYSRSDLKVLGAGRRCTCGTAWSNRQRRHNPWPVDCGQQKPQQDVGLHLRHPSEWGGSTRGHPTHRRWNSRGKAFHSCQMNFRYFFFTLLRFSLITFIRYDLIIVWSNWTKCTPPREDTSGENRILALQLIYKSDVS